ncbi:hypothetical protein THRCLA_21099 [Thraustotheca clavata]|uniref:R3H domain-containing protein n=1 Tax=Thraustotheca clavata TaxID=74557 RepID=A0A1W0A076_9STRA|nr:hypothetical protein THRCLA_21099 [Thraustotheca clavata]
MERELMMAVQADEDDWENVAEAEMTKKLSQLQLQNGQMNTREDRWTMGMSSPVSRGGIAAVSASEPLDSVLVAALDNPRERLTLLQFEDQIVKFIRSGREQQLVFPPLSSYHRLIIHRLAERCNLEHQTAEYNPYTGGYDGNSSRVVTLFKTPKCFVPSVLLINLSAEQSQQPPRHHTIAPKIMTRNRNSDKQKKHTKAINNDTRSRNLEDREKAYAEARARIFGTDNDSTSPQSNTTAENNDKTIKAVKPTAVEKNERPRPQNWKESKVTWRNREQEMNDPDFTRHRTPYRAPSPSYNNGYYVVNPNEYSRTEYNYRQTPPPPPEYYGQSSRQVSNFNSYPRAAPIPNEKPNFACDNDFPPLGQ